MNTLKRLAAFCLGLFSIGSSFGESQTMTGEQLETIINQLAPDSVETDGNVIQFNFKGVELICIYDEYHDRMRVISQIIPYEDVTEAQKDLLLDSNFHGALDGRYCTSNGILYAAFIHPLSSLSQRDALSAIYQVASLNLSFDDSYSSGVLSFGESAAEIKKNAI